MPQPVRTGEAFVLLVIALACVPVFRAYGTSGGSRWLVAGYTALLVGRMAAVADRVYWEAALHVVERGVGIALAGALFLGYFYAEWRTAVRQPGRTVVGERPGGEQ